MPHQNNNILSQKLQDLFTAIKENNKDQVNELLDEDRELLAAQDNKGMSALHIASQAGFHSIVYLLLEKGADVKAVDQNGRTALHYVSLHGKHYSRNESSRSLYGRINIRPPRGLVDPLIMGTINQPKPFYQKEKYNEKSKDYLKVVDSLLTYNAHLEAKDKKSLTPLRESIQYSHTALSMFLIQKGAATHNNGDISSLLGRAHGRGNIETIRLILEKGIDPNLENDLRSDLKEALALLSWGVDSHNSGIIALYLMYLYKSNKKLDDIEMRDWEKTFPDNRNKVKENLNYLLMEEKVKKTFFNPASIKQSSAFTVEACKKQRIERITVTLWCLCDEEQQACLMKLFYGIRHKDIPMELKLNITDQFFQDPLNDQFQKNRLFQSYQASHLEVYQAITLLAERLIQQKDMILGDLLNTRKKTDKPDPLSRKTLFDIIWREMKEITIPQAEIEKETDSIWAYFKLDFQSAPTSPRFSA